MYTTNMELHSSSYPDLAAEKKSLGTSNHSQQSSIDVSSRLVQDQDAPMSRHLRRDKADSGSYPEDDLATTICSGEKISCSISC